LFGKINTSESWGVQDKTSNIIIIIVIIIASLETKLQGRSKCHVLGSLLRMIYADDDYTFSLIMASLDTLESRYTQLTERFFTHCLHYFATGQTRYVSDRPTTPRQAFRTAAHVRTVSLNTANLLFNFPYVILLNFPRI